MMRGMSMRRRPDPPMAAMPVKNSVTRLGAGVTSQGQSYPGGLDLLTPSLNLQPGALVDGVNFEVLQNGGYGRIMGYERVDGHAAPSDATYQTLQVTAFTNVPSVTQTVTQASSGASGVVAAVDTTDLYMVLTKITGDFDDSGAVVVGATPIGTATAFTATVTDLEAAQYLNAAADIYRTDILVVPGSGNVLGVVNLNDVIYAFRANAGGTAVDLYKSSASGWVNVPFYKIVEFTAGGTATPADGAVLTQGGVTATVKRVMMRSGAWTGSAAGGFVVANVAGGNFAAGAATLTGGTTVTLSGAETNITMTPGTTQMELFRGNFSGQATSLRVYGCDGVNKGFEFDGDTLAPITTGFSPDTPAHLAVHGDYLFWFKDASAVFCGPGTPFVYTAGGGGGEIACGDNVTGAISLPGAQTTAALGVFMTESTAVLYGTALSDFRLDRFNLGVGAIPGSLQDLFQTFVFDSSGVITLQTTLNFGNFTQEALTSNLMPFIKQQRTKVTASAHLHEKGQYRAFFSDGYGLWLTMMGSRYLGAAIVLFPDPVLCCDTANLADGEEVSYFGSDTGYVYQLERGTSFDGADIDASLVPAWDAQKNPRLLKDYRAASIEVSGSTYASISFGYSLAYGSTRLGQPSTATYTSNFSAAVWDEFTWDEFTWDGQTLIPTEVDMVGCAENVQPIITSGTDYIAAFQINSIIYDWSPRRLMRGGG